jgi:cysteine desulfurase
VLLGLCGAAYGDMHVISTEIEHKAVLEPLEFLKRRGVSVTLLPVGAGGCIEPASIRQALRPNTMLVSVMLANNETRVLQPVAEIADVLVGHPAFLHTDAAQGFGIGFEALRNPRIDLISISGHKIFGPKGVGALIARKRSFERPPLQPLMYGGGQERGLRPGTLPVALVAAFGEAAELCARNKRERKTACSRTRQQLIAALRDFNPVLTGDQSHVMDHVVNLRIPGLDAEALIVGLKDLVAISNGSACTSHSYSPSHVLKAMGMSDDEANGCVRMSWCHLTQPVDWDALRQRIAKLM